MKKVICNEKGHFLYEGSIILTAKDGSIFYVSIEMLVCKAYRAKAKKPFINARYNKIEHMREVVIRNIEKCNSMQEIKEKLSREKAAGVKKFRENLKVGDVLFTSWGYEQTNVDFYQVIAVKGAFCEVREIAKRTHEFASMQSEVSPKQNEFIGEPIKRKILDHHILINSHIRAMLLDYETLETETKVYKRCYASSYA